MYKTDGIKWSAKEYTITGFLDCFKKLPQLVKVSQGFHGDYLVDCIGAEEILWVHSVSNQRRVLGKDSSGQPLSIPYDYHIRLILVQDANPEYPPMSLRKLLDLHELPFKVRLPRAEEAEEAVWQDDEADDLGIIHLESQFENRHLLVSCVLVDKLDTRVRMLPANLSQIRFVVAEGFAIGDKSAWKELKSELKKAADNIDIDGISGTSDIAMYAYSTASKAEQLIFTRFVTVRKTEAARKRSMSEGTVKETNMVGHWRNKVKVLYHGAMDDLNERFKKWKTRAEDGREEGANAKELSAEGDSSIDEEIHRNNYELIQVSKAHTSLIRAESLHPQEMYANRPKGHTREIKPEEEPKSKSVYEIVAVDVDRVISRDGTISPKPKSVYQNVDVGVGRVILRDATTSPTSTDKTSKLKQQNVPKVKPQVAAKPKLLSPKRSNSAIEPTFSTTGGECMTKSVDMSSPTAKPQIAVLPILAENTPRDNMAYSRNNFSSLSDIPIDISSLSADDISKCLRLLNLDESIISVFKAKQLDGAFLSMIQEEQLRKFFQDETAISVIDTERTVNFFKKGWRPS